MSIFKIISATCLVSLLAACGGSTGFPPVITGVKVQTLKYGNTATVYLGGKDLRSSITVESNGGCTNPSFASNSTTDTLVLNCVVKLVGDVPLTFKAEDGSVIYTTTLTVPKPQVTLFTTKGTVVLELDPSTEQLVAEWLQLHPQTHRLQMATQAHGARVVFDPEHLQRILINLLDNADRYATAADGAIRVLTELTESGHRLAVWSEGAELPATVAQHLFEPFTSSNSRSSGLGLYLSQELCVRHAALLTYQRCEMDGRGGNAFIVQFTAAPPITAQG
jgi:hypothetical protein